MVGQLQVSHGFNMAFFRATYFIILTQVKYLLCGLNRILPLGQSHDSAQLDVVGYLKVSHGFDGAFSDRLMDGFVRLSLSPASTPRTSSSRFSYSSYPSSLTLIFYAFKFSCSLLFPRNQITWQISFIYHHLTCLFNDCSLRN